MPQKIATTYSSSFQPTDQPQAFPYQGSKRGQVPIINSLIPEGKPRLIEPFAGSAAVSIGTRWNGKTSSTVIGDSNAAIVDLWENIITRPDELVRGYKTIWLQQFSDDYEEDYRAFFMEVRQKYNDRPENEEDAATFLFLLNRIVKAALRYNGRKMNQSADRRRAGARPETVLKRVSQASEVLQGSDLFLGDWYELASHATADDVVYLDPPYQGTTDTQDKRYSSGMNVDVFESKVADLFDKGISAIISYDAIKGPKTYGRPLDPSLNLLAIDVVTGVSSQGTLLGRKQEAHETLYLTPGLVSRLGGESEVLKRVKADHEEQLSMF